MAFENFKPTIWSKYIQQQLDKYTILEANCNKKFQGEIGPGREVKIIGAYRPTVKTYTPSTNIEAAQTPADDAVFLKVDQYKYVHFAVDDIDEAQSVEGLMQAYMEGSTKALAEGRDAYIGTLAQYATSGMMSASSSANTEDEALALLDAALVKLWDNGVGKGDVVVEATPWFYKNILNALVTASTNNITMLGSGDVKMYNGASVLMSNNLYNDDTDDYIMVRTKDAIAFAGGIHKTEAYRPDLLFGDAIKVLDCYGAKIVRPKELYVIKAHNS